MGSLVRCVGSRFPAIVPFGERLVCLAMTRHCVWAGIIMSVRIYTVIDRGLCEGNLYGLTISSQWKIDLDDQRVREDMLGPVVSTRNDCNRRTNGGRRGDARIEPCEF